MARYEFPAQGISQCGVGSRCGHDHALSEWNVAHFAILLRDSNLLSVSVLSVRWWSCAKPNEHAVFCQGNKDSRYVSVDPVTFPLLFSVHIQVRNRVEIFTEQTAWF